jgi:hypothetical protein
MASTPPDSPTSQQAWEAEERIVNARRGKVTADRLAAARRRRIATALKAQDVEKRINGGHV